MDNYIWLIWDIAAVLLIVWCIRDSARRGLIRTIIGLCACFVAFFVAQRFREQLADLLYEHLARDALTLLVSRRLESAGATDTLAEMTELFPKVFQRFLAPGLDAEVSDAASEVVRGVIESALREPILYMLEGVCFLILFSLVMLVARAVSRLFSGLYHVPLIGTANTLLGGVVGVFQAILFMLIGSLALRFVIFLSEDSLSWLNSGVLDDTFIWRVFYRLTAPGS